MMFFMFLCSGTNISCPVIWNILSMFQKHGQEQGFPLTSSLEMFYGVWHLHTRKYYQSQPSMGADRPNVFLYQQAIYYMKELA